MSDPIAEYLARGGRIERCPTAIVAKTADAALPADAQQQLAEHQERLDAAKRERLRMSRAVYNAQFRPWRLRPKASRS